MPDTETDEVKDDAVSESVAPPHSWVGIGFGLAVVLALGAIAILMALQYSGNRPVDLTEASLQTSKIVAEVLHAAQVPPEDIVLRGPELQKTLLAHVYHFDYQVTLPATLSPSGVAKLIERDMFTAGVVISENSPHGRGRRLAFALGDYPVGTITLVHASPSPLVLARETVQLHEELETQASDVREEPGLWQPAAAKVHSTPKDARTQTALEEQSEVALSSSREIPLLREGWSPPSASSIRRRAVRRSTASDREKVAANHPRVAIIVDDGGYGGISTDVILGLTSRLTLSILPNTPFGRELAEEAAANGFEVMLHMPMENMTDKLVFEGQIDTDMNEAEMRRLLLDALDQVPGAVGLNNHTGSKFTANPTALPLFLSSVRDQGLFFVDSITTPDSIAYEISKSIGIPSGYRDLFLDHDDDIDMIRGRFRELMDRAIQEGTAIGICHFRPNSAKVLREMLPELRMAGIELVHASELVR